MLSEGAVVVQRLKQWRRSDTNSIHIVRRCEYC